MDVIVNPTGSSGTEWSLDDRLGRHLGTIQIAQGSFPFVIEPEPAGGLRGVKLLHVSLDEAMSSIARKMGGTCELNSRDWD
ncbi:hypothetical protein [Methylobacterium durans]|uniref:Uncharacterized protein n=1 Tax=Methylobacterium durans TaxID=2202825 RepID=A0A2U8W1J5_9HYPH|nr:hypothetical protein [Methylobacterium durans]AWN39953.1 hypothetical protein DK389_04610 [Methylobacterium durans]